MPHQEVPADLVDSLALTISEALLIAEEGRVVRGYLLLQHGLQRIEDSVDPWADAHCRMWHQALELYKQRYPRDWYDFEASDDSAF